MIKRLLTAIVVGIGISTLVGGMLAVNNLTKLINNTPVAKSTQDLDTSMLPDVVEVKEPEQTSMEVNESGIPTLNLSRGNFVVLYGPIYENGNEVAEAIKRATTHRGPLAGNDPLYLLIDSPGGSVITGGAIISAMEASPVPVHTICLQLCASMGAMIHQYGVKRYSVNRSLLMFHDAAGGFQGPFQQVMSRMNTINRYVNKMFANVAKRSGQSYKDFMLKIGPEIWVDGEDAVTQHYSDSLVNVVFDNNDAVNPPSFETLQIKEEIKKKILSAEYIKQ
jgi:ATP-dependent Clp protease protease subunit